MFENYVLQGHDKVEVEYAEERLPVYQEWSTQRDYYAEKSCRRARVGPDYFATLNNLEHIMTDPLQKKKKNMWLSPKIKCFKLFFFFFVLFTCFLSRLL